MNDDTWMEFSGVVINKGYSILEQPASSSIDGRTQSLAFSLLARSLSNYSGALVLMEAGRIVEARMLVRACLENEFFLRALKADPKNFWTQLQVDDVKHRQQRGEHYFATSEGVDENVARRLREWLKKSKVEHPDAKSISPKKMAAGNPTYIAYAQMSSDAGHASQTSLSRHMVRNKSGVPQFTPHAPIGEDEVVDTFRWGCLSLIRACGTVNELIGKSENDSIQEIVERYGKLLGMW